MDRSDHPSLRFRCCAPRTYPRSRATAATAPGAQETDNLSSVRDRPGRNGKQLEGKPAGCHTHACEGMRTTTDGASSADEHSLRRRDRGHPWPHRGRRVCGPARGAAPRVRASRCPHRLDPRAVMGQGLLHDLVVVRLDLLGAVADERLGTAAGRRLLLDPGQRVLCDELGGALPQVFSRDFGSSDEAQLADLAHRPLTVWKTRRRFPSTTYAEWTGPRFP